MTLFRSTFRNDMACAGCGARGEQVWLDTIESLCWECRMGRKKTTSADSNNWAHYTPWDLAWQLVDNAVDPLLTAGLQAKDIYVWDPACGDGQLLLAAAVRLEQLGLPRAEALDHLSGCDIDDAAIQVARARFADWAGEEVFFLRTTSAFDEEWSAEFGRCKGPNCVVMNPPYKGGNKIDVSMRKVLQGRWPGPLSADLSAYFLRLAGDVAGVSRSPASIGALATNTIAQGHTRELGLLPMLEDGGWDLWATSPNLGWPGVAQVTCRLFVLTHAVPIPPERVTPLWASSRLRTASTPEDEEMCKMGRKKTTSAEMVVTQEQEAVRARATELATTYGGDMLRMFTAHEVSDEESLALATEGLQEIKRLRSEVEAERKRGTDPLNAVITTIRGWFRPAEEALAQCETVLRGKVAEYLAGVRAKNEAAVQATAAAAALGDVQAATEALATITSAALPEGLGTQRRWDFHLTNIGLVPEEYLMLDEAKVRKAMQAAVQEGQVPGETWHVPGVLFAQVESVVVRR